MELIRSYRSTDVGIPQITVGSAPALTVSRPAQRSLVLQPADSPSRLMRPSPPEASAALLPPPLLRLLPGGAIQFPGGSFLAMWTNVFSRRTVNACLQQLRRGAILVACSATQVLYRTLNLEVPALSPSFGAAAGWGSICLEQSWVKIAFFQWQQMRGCETTWSNAGLVVSGSEPM